MRLCGSYVSEIRPGSDWGVSRVVAVKACRATGGRYSPSVHVRGDECVQVFAAVPDDGPAPLPSRA